MDVWNSIRDDTTMIFQWESSSASAYLKQLFSDETVKKIKEIDDNFSYMNLLSIGNGAIRPAGESYRNNLSMGVPQKYGNEALDNFMKTTLGFMVYQEQVMNFLHQFCGYTMGEADIVRRGFAKKTGTEKFIPKIKNGFAKHMNEFYEMSEAESERLVSTFVKVIEDASDYLFSENHALPYSYIGYICGYLRYYYPLEFITTALNIFEDNEEKTLAIISYARKRHIPISPIKFRHSIAQYDFDKETNQIFKGISSIKYMNKVVADELYALKDNEYKQFIDLLYDITEKTSINSRQLQILIDLDFFDEFGNANYLHAQYKLYNDLSGRKNLAKSKVTKLKIDSDMVAKNSSNITAKMYMGVNTRKLLIELAAGVSCRPRKLSEKIYAQLNHLGYIDIPANDKYNGMAVVVSLDTKYSPRLIMHSLKNATSVSCKIDKKTFNKHKLKSGDIVRILNQKWKSKIRKNEFGEWEDIPGTKELWITKYEVEDWL